MAAPGQADGGQDFVRRQGRFINTGEEIRHADPALPGRRLQQNVPPQGQATGAEFGRRVGHGEAAANRAPMAHTGMGNMLDRLMQQGEFPADQGTRGQFAMAHQSADLDISVAFDNLLQWLQTANIN